MLRPAQGSIRQPKSTLILVFASFLVGGCEMLQPDLLDLQPSATPGVAPISASAPSAAPPTEKAVTYPTADQPSDTQAPATPVPEQPADVGFLGIELQPEDPMPGGQFLLIQNGSSAAVELTCWSVGSLISAARWVIGDQTSLAPGSIARLTIVEGALSEIDQLQLADSQGRIVDQTPELGDPHHDDQIWFRDPVGGWQFGRTLFHRDLIDVSMFQERPEGC